MKSRGFVERGVMFAKNLGDAKGMRRRIRIALLIGTAVFMLWSSPTTAKPGLPAVPLAAPLTVSPQAITNVTLLLENDNANGAVFGGLATGAGGFGVVGFASATSSKNSGVAGATNSDTGTGVLGLAFATACPSLQPVTLGLTCVGVFGQSLSISGNTAGVAGTTRSDSGNGVAGFATATSGVNSGVFGQDDSTDGRGVTGFATATSGNNSGVFGLTNSPLGVGVQGIAAATSGSGIGVSGFASATSGSAIGVFGESLSSAGTGIWGIGFNGVFGESFSSGGTGILGEGFSGALAGAFFGPVQISGNLTVTGNSTVTGTKSALVDTVSYGKRQLYAVESPESWFEDFGSANLTKGHAIVMLDPIFAQTVNTRDDYHIFLTPKGECKGLYVAHQGATSFEVKELQNGKSSIAFDYRIVAKRRGYERARLPEPMK